MEPQKIPFHRALLWILVSVLLISGSSFMGWQYYLHVREKKFQDEQYRIVALVQNTPQTERLNTVYLAEILELSLDRPVNLFQFSAKEAERKLCESPLIQSAVVRKILPGTVYVNYQIRTPIAYVGDYANTAIDETGYLFPFRPFFTPKRLPTFYLGVEKTELNWGCCLNTHPSMPQALDLMDALSYLEPLQLAIKVVDLSLARADSFGQRQLIVVLERLPNDWSNPSSNNQQIYLRLSSDHFHQNIFNFRTLYTSLMEDDPKKFLEKKIIILDLRIPHLAFIKTGD